MDRAVADAFLKRPHLVDAAPGYIGMEVFTGHHDPACFYLVTRWSDAASYEAWHGSQDHIESHKGIPKGLKLDPKFTKLVFADRLPATGDMPVSTMDWSGLLAGFLAQSSAACFVVAALDGIIEACNPEFAALVNRPDDSVPGQPIWDFMTEADSQSLRRRLAAGRALDQPVLLNFVGCDLSPCTLECSIDVQPNRFAIVGAHPRRKNRELQDELIRINNDLSVSARENTRQAKLLTRTHKDLQRTAAELARSNAELQRFAYATSHDLQEPLRTIASFAQLLASRKAAAFDPEAREWLDLIVGASARMKELINALLQYAQIGQPSRSVVDCGNLLQEALWSLQAAIRETGALVTHDPLPQLECDPVQVRQLFQNLIGNAIKYRGEAAPRIHIGAAQTAEVWTFSIGDNGQGFRREYAEKIFGVFTRLHGKQTPGTGIGLALCKKVVDLHGGRIWAESEPGKGSVFSFTLPKLAVNHATPATR